MLVNLSAGTGSIEPSDSAANFARSKTDRREAVIARSDSISGNCLSPEKQRERSWKA
jgi:hypothetical protein